LSAGDLDGVRYDNLGNPDSWYGNRLTWARIGDLTRYGSHEYRYDAFGVRQEKRVNGVLSHIYYAEGATIHREDRPQTNTSLRYHYDVTGITGFQLMQGSVSQGHFHFTKNVFGDVVGISDNGVLLARYEYDSWGNHRCIDPNGNIITDTNHVGLINPIRWRSGYYDSETNLHYVSGRYFDPKLGVILNSTLDEAEAVGGYSHDLTNPATIFGNTFSQATWGYPSLWEPTAQELADLEIYYRPQGGWRWSWRWFWAAVGVTVLAVVAGAFTFGIGFKIVKGAFLPVFLGGLKTGAVIGTASVISTGMRTNGFTEMTSRDWRGLAITGFTAGFGGGVGKAFTMSTTKKLGTSTHLAKSLMITQHSAKALKVQGMGLTMAVGLTSYMMHSLVTRRTPTPFGILTSLVATGHDAADEFIAFLLELLS